MSFKLFCLILPDPDPAQHVFPVNIDKNQTVGDLKDLIKAKKSNALRNIDAAELIVWKLEPAIAAEGLQTALEALTFDGDARELEAMDEMEEVLNEAPAKKHLHIVAHLPTPRKSLQLLTLNDHLSLSLHPQKSAPAASLMQTRITQSVANLPLSHRPLLLPPLTTRGCQALRKS